MIGAPLIPLMAAIAGASRPIGVISLTNEGLSGEDSSGSQADIDVRFDVDGGIRAFLDSVVGGSIVDLTPWSSAHPNENRTGYYARLVSHDSGTDRYTGTPALGTWVEITGTGTPTFDWAWAPGGGPAGPDVSTYTLAISDDGGSTTLDTMTVTITLSIAAP